MKKCSKCKSIKEFTEFKKHRSHADGLSSQCKACISDNRKQPDIRMRDRETTKLWRSKNPDKQREYRLRFRNTEAGQRSVVNSLLKTNYGITVDQYNEMFQSQEGKCSICRTHQSSLSRRLSVDHDHKTGKVRSLLCNFCNTAIGSFKDSTDLLNRAIEYLQKHQ